MEPFLVFRRTGRVIAAVLALGFGGGTLLIGVTTAAGSAFSGAAVWAALKGYFLVSLPFFVAGAILAGCRRELWVIPSDGVLRMLTFRPWRLRGPRVEQAPISEYDGVCIVSLDHRAEASTFAVALCTGEERIPVREYTARAEAEDFAGALAEVTGLRRIRAAEPATS